MDNLAHNASNSALGHTVSDMFVEVNSGYPISLFWHWTIQTPNSFSSQHRVGNTSNTIEDLTAKAANHFHNPPEIHITRASKISGSSDYSVLIGGTLAICCQIDSDGDCWLFATSLVSLQAATKIIDALAAVVDIKTTTAANTIEFSLWYNSVSGVKKKRRDLFVPTWFDIKQNYALTTQEQIERILVYLETGRTERGIIILHGAAGSGKTTMVRALCRTLVDKFSANYITDIDSFLGSPSYLMDILMDNETNTSDLDILMAPRQSSVRGKFVICEDADAILCTEARERSGSNFGTLLNASDGILGQGSKTVFILSANRAREEIDPAILRNGRCVGEVMFHALPKSQARLWAENNGVNPDSITEDTVLADLYALKNEVQVVRSAPVEESRVGFK